MKPRLRYLLWLVLGSLGCSPVDAPPSGRLSQPVVAGQTAPDGLGFAIDRLQRGAVLGQLVKMGATQYQGCSGTLVGDRVVVSAAHCVVLNEGQWAAGAKPQLVAPEDLFYVVGDDVRKPICLLGAKTVQIHPQAAEDPKTGFILHDVSVTILADSATASCPSAVPVQINRDPLEATLVGQMVLQGGFGALDESYDFSPVRYWSLVQVSAVTDDHVVVRDAQHGFPSFGDSGSGILRRFPDGTLRNLGVCSVGAVELMGFMRLDPQGSFFDSVITHDLLCGPVTDKGTCRDGMLVACGTNGFTTVDCAAQGRRCASTGDGALCLAADQTTGQDGSVAPDAGTAASGQGGCGLAGRRPPTSVRLPFGLLALLGLLLMLSARRRRRALPLSTLLVLLAFAPGCSHEDARPPDATVPSPDAAVDAHPADLAPRDLGAVENSTPPTGSCTSPAALTDPEACGAGWSCDVADLTYEIVGCRPVGTTAAFAVCSPQTPPCVAGTTCFGIDTANYKCLPFCKGTSDTACASNGYCANLTAAVVICLAPDACDVMTSKGCPSQFAPSCYFLDESGKSFCWYRGSVPAGGACHYDTDCVPGSGCQKGACARWCHGDGDCTQPATCQGIGSIPDHADLGHCG